MAGTGIAFLNSSFSAENNFLQTEAELIPPPLPYPYDALKPYIDQPTMEPHYSKHHQGYVNNLKKAMEELTQKVSLEEICKNISKYPAAACVLFVTFAR